MSGDTRLKAEQLREIIDVSALITSSLDPKEIRRRAVEAATRLVDAERASLLLASGRNHHMYFEVALGDESGELARVSMVPGQGIAGTVLSTGTPIIVDDVQSDPRHCADIDQKTGFAPRTMICAPLICKGTTLGVLQVINKRSGDFDEEDLAIVTALANQIAIAVENARLYRRLRRSFLETAAYVAIFATAFIAAGLWLVSLGR